MEGAWLILILPVSVIIGVFIGILVAKIKLSSTNKKLIKNAKQVLEGNKENIYVLPGGKKINVTKFKVKDDDGNEELELVFGKGTVEEKRVPEVRKEEIKSIVDIEEKKKKPIKKRKKK
jgi:hypothetical protein